MTLTNDELNTIDMAILLAFLLTSGAMMVAMAAHALVRHGQPLRYIIDVNWAARMAWSASLFVFGVWIGALVRIVDIATDGHDTTAAVLVSDAIRLIFAVMMYLAWRAWSRAM